MTSRALLLIALVALAALACSDKNEPTGPVQQAPQLADYLWFDTTSILLAHSSHGHINWSEATFYVDGDSIVGEPFGDANGNGVYDPGVDTFVMSQYSDNMDYNHNGRYDGPNDPYYVGEPIGDYNENGVYDPPNFRYDIGEPFADMNGDGVRELISAECVHGQWHPDSTGATYTWHDFDSVAVWTSPLGERYSFPYFNDVWDYQHDEYVRNPSVTFHLDVDGLQYRDDEGWRIPLADTDSSVAGDTTVTAVLESDTTFILTARRTIEFGQSIEIDSTLYENLLRIKLDSFQTDTSEFDWASFEFYFSKDLGLLAATWTDVSGHPGYFERFGQLDSLPQPMIRDTITPQP